MGTMCVWSSGSSCVLRLSISYNPQRGIRKVSIFNTKGRPVCAQNFAGKITEDLSPTSSFEQLCKTMVLTNQYFRQVDAKFIGDGDGFTAYVDTMNPIELRKEFNASGQVPNPRKQKRRQKRSNDLKICLENTRKE